MHVIPFKPWRVWFYVDELGRNGIRLWLDEKRVPGPDRAAFQALLDILEYSGADALSYSTIELGNGFYALKSKHEGGVMLAPIFIQGPFSPTEVTFLAGAAFEGKKLKPRYAVGIAEENLEALRANPKRRRRERLD